MRTPRLALTRLVALIAIGALTSALALADPERAQRRDSRSGGDTRSGERRAVRDVVGEVEHNYRGHVVDVQPPAANDDMYRVRVLQEGGRVKTVRVPAKRERRRD